MNAVNSVGLGEASAPEATQQARTARKDGGEAARPDQDTVTISDEGRSKAEAMRAEGRNSGEAPDGVQGLGQEQGKAEANMLVESKDDIVRDLQDTESDIRRTKDKIESAKRSSRPEEHGQELAKLKTKLDDLEDEADDMESKLSR